MSVHAVERKRGAAYEVRYRTLDGRNRAKRFETPEAASDFDAAVQARIALDKATATWDALAPRMRRAAAAAAAE
jgi:hypothetical protein